jgi:fumarate reductase flavoprotein subunit
MQQVMEDSAGIFRTQAFLSKGADALRELQERSASVAIEDHSREFNTQVVAALELSYMLDVAEAIIACALRREESRGAHQRLDHPARDDDRFLAHSLIRRGSDGAHQVEYLPVALTRWPPGERVYGR